MRILTKEIPEHIGKEVELMGWVATRRDHGKLIFLDLRDRSGICQLVFLPPRRPEGVGVPTEASESVYESAKKLRSEWVIRVKGVVAERPEAMRNPEIPTGMVEIPVTTLEILNESETPPFPIETAGYDIDEETRLTYRYLDLRRPRLQKNIRMRDAIISFFRDYMHAREFVEIETPIMMRGTPEGSREYVVPSRLEKGKFYVLPQSPQQFKQLAMVAGFERYFQIARCFRDEDTRGDRQPEFTQLDFEMSFVTQEDVLQYTEAMFIKLIETLYPNKTITHTPFPRLTFAESMKQHGSDKPDLRKDKNNPDELAFAWITDFPMFEKNKEGEMVAAHHPFCSINEEDMEKFMAGEDLFSIRANSYDLVLNGYELSSGSIRIHQPEVQRRVFELLGITPEEQQKKFGHMLEAFKYGTPPHGGFAPGIDRIVMILQNEPNIREVIAFAKTGEGRDPMMKAPAEIDPKQLEELGLEIKKKVK